VNHHLHYGVGTRSSRESLGREKDGGKTSGVLQAGKDVLWRATEAGWRPSSHGMLGYISKLGIRFHFTRVVQSRKAQKGSSG